MAIKYNTLMTKAFKPLKRFLGENSDKRWPPKVLDILETEYQLLPKDLLRLWYVQCRIRIDKFNIDRIYIYDWLTSQEQNIPINNYHDLSKDYKLLLFKGNVFQDGSVYFEKVGSISSMN